MKSKLLLVVACLMLGISLLSQAQDERKTYLGVKGGYNFSGVNVYHSFYRYDINQEIKNGVQGGIIVMNYLRNHIGIQAELNYTQKGYKQKFLSGETYSERFNYVELPFLFNLHTGKKDFHVFFNAGCYFEYLLSVDATSPNLANISEDEDFDPYVKSRDPNYGYGYRGGLGVFYDLPIGTFMVEASFSYDLSNYIDPPSYDSGEPILSNHMVGTVSVAYLISFGELK